MDPKIVHEMKTSDLLDLMESIEQELERRPQRCTLKCAHAGEHLFVHGDAKPLLGDCEAVKPRHREAVTCTHTSGFYKEGVACFNCGKRPDQEVAA